MSNTTLQILLHKYIRSTWIFLTSKKLQIWIHLSACTLASATYTSACTWIRENRVPCNIELTGSSFLDYLIKYERDDRNLWKSQYAIPVKTCLYTKNGSFISKKPDRLEDFSCLLIPRLLIWFFQMNTLTKSKFKSIIIFEI